ncbi:MAG: glycosyltransferase family 2 protein [Capsulimonadaceae bacterium]|nr:glycosyltransferase family 2 protein [Capsulimonadaceae bacterium]
MIHGKKVVVVMPAYNAERTLERTYREIPHDIVDDVVLVDDASRDGTARLAAELGITTIIHEQNTGYGGNQKTCYKTALDKGADVVVMLHPDYQYTPKLITAMASLIGIEQYDFVLASRILCGSARAGGMPAYKYFSNRLLTFIQNVLLSAKFSEYHTGYRAFSRKLLLDLPLNENSDDFVFDNQMIAQALMLGFKGGEVSCPTKYFAEASSINFSRSVKYGLGVLLTSVQYFAHRHHIANFRYLSADGRRLEVSPSGAGE